MEFNGGSESSPSSKNDIVSDKGRRVGLIFDDRMCKHYTPDEEDHPECPDRIRVIWDRLNSSGLAQRCIVLNAKDAEDKHIALVHTKSHINLIKNISSQNSKSKRKRIASNFNSIYFNEGSSEAAYLAAGSVVEAVEKVAKGELDSAFAIVRPPGHHAEEDEPMGFCLYNNVGIATSFLLNERSELGIKKILIVDWDVHHGNGTQKMFYKDHRVLFFSVHRYDNGTFYPSGHDGSYIMTGEEPGAGYNINVPWDKGRCGDADYLAVWDHILIPVAKEFNPDMVIISAGFDAAIGDPLGGCRVSPYGYSVMLDKLMEFAGGKIVMALEGGYNLNSIANSAKACVEVLLQDKPAIGLLEAYPFPSTWRVIQEVRQLLSTYWPVLAPKLPDKVINKTSQFEILSSDSDVEDENIPAAVSEVQTFEDVLQPFAKLKVNEDSRVLELGNKQKGRPNLPPRKKTVPTAPPTITGDASGDSSARTVFEQQPPAPAGTQVLHRARVYNVDDDDDVPIRQLSKRPAEPSADEPPAKRLTESDVANGYISQGLREYYKLVKSLEQAFMKMSSSLEKEKKNADKYAGQLTSMEHKLSREAELRRNAEEEVSRLEKRHAELEASAREVVANQGDLLRNFWNKMIRTVAFSRYVSQCGRAMLSIERAETLQEVKKAFPELDVLTEAFDYIEPNEDDMNRLYMDSARKPPKFSLLEKLASQTTLLTPEIVSNCKEDEDKAFLDFETEMAEIEAEEAAEEVAPTCEATEIPSDQVQAGEVRREEEVDG